MNTQYACCSACNHEWNSKLSTTEPCPECGDVPTSFHGKTFVVAGEFKGCRDAVKQYFTERGGKVAGAVSRDADYVIIGEYRVGADVKVTKAVELGIQVLTFEQFKATFAEYGFNHPPVPRAVMPQAVPMVHVGALLMWGSSNCEVMAVSNGTVCVKFDNGALDVAQELDVLSARPTAEQLAHKKAVADIVTVLNDAVREEMNSLDDYAEALIAAGYSL